ncbi:glutamate-1-semialdehyde 2,1-aminomutase [bacterium]|nr:glutamate-1-semialdehyde 2,1-aminomutase [bacterium]
MAKRHSHLWEKSLKYIPGGVNSPVRAFRKVGGTPIFIDRACGCRLHDCEGKEYIDYVLSWGPLILGHAHPHVISAIKTACQNGTSFGAPTEREALFAQMIAEAVPSIEKVRLVSSGTEATMTAIRLARGFSGKDDIIKFEGCYHGHSDSLLVKAGSGAATLGVPDSAGVPEDFARHTIALPYNDIETFVRAVEHNHETVACVIVEPVAANMGVVPPKGDFLRTLRDYCTRYDIILIFDEVITGFRLALGGAQELYGIIPDLTTLGKIIGGGMPIGALGGKAVIMDTLAPDGNVYQAGTLSGNPVAVAAGIATLKVLLEENPYQELDRLTRMLADGFRRITQKLSIQSCITQVGSMMSLFFSNETVRDFQAVLRADSERYRNYFHGMLSRGIYLAPSPYEATFLSTAHTEGDIQRTLEAAEESLRQI